MHENADKKHQHDGQAPENRQTDPNYAVGLHSGYNLILNPRPLPQNFDTYQTSLEAKYQGATLWPTDYAAMVDLEKELGQPIPNVDNYLSIEELDEMERGFHAVEGRVVHLKLGSLVIANERSDFDQFGIPDSQYRRKFVFPPSFKHLTGLRVLDLGESVIPTLPEILFPLLESPELERLVIQDFEGNAIRRDRKGRLISLDLSVTGLRMLSASIGRLIHLKKLDLNGNELSTLPCSIGKLVELVELDLKTNKLKDLPQSMTQLVNLENLNIAGNSFHELPECVAACKKMNTFNISENKINSFPKWIDSLPNLVNFIAFGIKRKKEWKKAKKT